MTTNGVSFQYKNVLFLLKRGEEGKKVYDNEHVLHAYGVKIQMTRA